MFPKLKELLGQQKHLFVTAHVTPKSRENQLINLSINGTGTVELKLKIRGVPEKGQVNKNLLQFLSRSLDLPISCCQIVSGHSSRHKIIALNIDAL